MMEERIISEYLSKVMKKAFGEVLGRSILKKQIEDLNIQEDEVSERELRKLSDNIYRATQDMGEEKAEEVRDKILEATKLVGTQEESWKAEIAKGDAKREMSEWGSAKDHYMTALEEFEGEEEEKADIYRKLGSVLQRTEEYELGEEYFDKAADIAGDAGKVANCLEGKSGTLWRQGKHREALETAKKGMEELDEMPTVSRNQERKKKEYQAMICRSIGNIYLDLNEKDKSIEYCKKAIDLYEDLDKKGNAGVVHNNLARVYEDFEEYDKAIENYDKAVSLCKESGNRFMSGWSMFNYASVLCEEGKPGDALEYCQKAEKIMDEFNHKLGQSRVKCMKGKAYKEKGLYDKAEEFFDESLDLLEGTQTTDYIEITKLEYARMLEERGEVDRAMDELERAKDIHGDKEETITSERVKDFLDRLE